MPYKVFHWSVVHLIQLGWLGSKAQGKAYFCLPSIVAYQLSYLLSLYILCNFVWRKIMLGSVLSSSVLSFHLFLQTIGAVGLLHTGHCSRDCGHTQLPKKCCRYATEALWRNWKGALLGPVGSGFAGELQPF